MRNALPIAIAFALLLLAPHARAAPPKAHVAGGDLTGTREVGTNAFLGIPFASAPIGALRWRAPEPVLPWIGARDATKLGPACMQQDIQPEAPWSREYFVGPPYSEDCLTLNVWTTARRGGSQAVLVYVPGGGFAQGGGAVPIYNGAALARAGIVVVTINYRLSAAGFLAHPGLVAESPRHASGNYALMDVLAALRWVKENIAAFGGDPAKVTVMGQSAGASAVNALLSSPQSRGLFRAAIINSGVRPGPRYQTAAEREKMSADWAAARGAATLAELRALPADALVPVRADTFRFAPFVDGDVVPKHVDLNAPPLIDVPIMTGWNAGEGADGGPPAKPVSRAEFDAAAKSMLGAQAREMETLYPVDGDDASAPMHVAAHDAIMMGGAVWAAARTKYARAPVYYFDFEHVMPGDTAAQWGAYHSSELPYLFGTLDVLDRPWTATDREVARLTQGYLVNFIKTGDPNGRGLAHWTPFDAAKDDVMALGATPGMRPIASPAKTALFRGYYAKFLAP